MDLHSEYILLRDRGGNVPARPGGGRKRAIKIRACVQPVSEPDARRHGRGGRVSRGFAVYTPSRLRMADPFAKTGPDIIEIGGEGYEILFSVPYMHGNKIFYKGIAAK